jgi:hypothetical protein
MMGLDANLAGRQSIVPLTCTRRRVLVVSGLAIAAAACSRNVPAVGANPVSNTLDVQVIVYNRSVSRATISVEYERGVRRRLGSIESGVQGLLTFPWRPDIRVRLLSRVGGGSWQRTIFLSVPRGSRLELTVAPTGRPLLRLLT